MKKIFAYILIAGLSLSMVSCDKFFDSMEGDLDKVAAEDLLSTENGLLSLLADLYSKVPGNGVSDNDKYQMFGNGARDVPSYGNTVSGFWDYTSVRAVNIFLNAVESCRENGVLDNETADKYKGEGLFLRAYYYFASVRVYGGIPIVEQVLDDEFGKNDNAGLYIPRRKEKESWDWVIDQFDQAAKLLPEHQTQEMRATKYAAYALEARAALWAASESKYWDRAPVNPSYVARQKELTLMKPEYAKDYYQKAVDATGAIINDSHNPYSLYGGVPNSLSAAIDNLEQLFQTYKTEEGIFGRSYKTGDASTTNGTEKWVPNQFAKGYTGTGAANYAVTLNLADEYDYYDSADSRKRKDGTIQTLVSGDESAYFLDPETEFTKDKVASYKHYDNITDPFTLKDARFQAWVIYPGVQFRGTTVYMQGGWVKQNGDVEVYPEAKSNGDGNNGVTFQGETYYPYGGASQENSSFMGLTTDKNGNNRNSYCFSPKKYVDLKSDNQYVQSPYYDVRYAEVLLTYAEAALEGNVGDPTLAAKCLNDVRHRAGFTDDVALNIDNILHEWKCEFAFENKWSSVLYRRRGFYNPSNTNNQEEGTVGRKLTLIPMVDLSGTKAQYIFLRSIPVTATSKYWGYSGTLSYNGTYYNGIPNYDKNKIEDNNK
jgi:hypothetical protein